MDTQQETILQAVILADPFEHQARYGPLIRGGGQDGEGGEDAQPWSLLPFCNAPLIAWTLESLSASNVQKAFIVIREGAKELQEWLDSSTFMAPTASMSIRIRQTQAYSEGDVMREVDGLALTGDWLLVRAGYMGNLDLQTAVESFTARRKKEQGLLMECLVSQRKTKSPSAKVSTHILTPQKHLVHFTHHSRFPRRRRAHFPLELLEDDKEALGRELAIRTDLESIGVDICNMEVPALFVENFDYQNMRPDFINGVLTSDLLGKTIRCTVIGEGRNGASGDVGACNARAVPWAAHVGDLASYAQISKAVISRWSYPLTPDEMIPGTSSRYEQRRSRLYVGKRLHLARSCTVGAASIIGHGSSIGDHSTVSHSVIGENCRIAANVRITNSFIFEGAIIEDGCTVRDSVVSQGVRIKKGSEMAGGTLIGPGVIIGDGASLFASRAAAQPWDEEASSEDTRVAAHANGSGPLGSGSRGHLWPSEVDVFEAEDADSDDEDGHDVRNLKISSLRVVDADEAAGYHSATSSGSTISRSSSSSSFASDASGASSRASGMADPPAIAGIGALMSNDDSAAAADAAFERECTSSLERSFSEGHTVENAAIELKTLRMASNVPLRQVVSVVVPFMCRQVQGKLGAGAAPAEVSRAVNGLVERWGDLVASLTGGQESGQVEALLFLQEHCAAGEDDGSAHARLFPAFLQAYYQEDVVSEEAVRSWVTSPKAKSNGGSTGTKLWQTGAAFMRALMEAEDSDEEEEDDDDSE